MTTLSKMRCLQITIVNRRREAETSIPSESEGHGNSAALEPEAMEEDRLVSILLTPCGKKGYMQILTYFGLKK